MKLLSQILVVAIVVPTVVAAASVGAMDGYKTVTPQQVEWIPGSGLDPSSVETAVLYGDPGKDGAFALRLKMPQGYRVAPHSHQNPEFVTVVSGTFRIGTGKVADRNKARPLPPGSFVAIAPGMVHYAMADEDTVIQVTGIGPRSPTYVDPNDDPAQSTFWLPAQPM